MKGEKTMKKTLAIILTLAMVLCCFAACKKGGSDDAANASAEYTSDNAFAEAKDALPEDSDAYYVMDSAAAADNTIFNSESLTVKVNDDVYVKIVFGEDLASSELYVEVDDVKVAMYEGELAVSAGSTGVIANVKQILGDGLLTSIQNQLGSFVNLSDYIGSDVIETIDTNLPLIVKDHHLNRDAIRNIISAVVPNISGVITDSNIKALAKELGNFLLGLDELTVTDNAGAGDKSYSLSLTEDSGIQIAKQFMDLLKDNQNVRSLLGAIPVDQFVNEYYDDIADEAASSAGDTDELLNAVLVLNGNYFKSLNINNGDVIVLIDEVNEVKFEGAEYLVVKNQAENADSIVKVEKADDLLKAFLQLPFAGDLMSMVTA